ncbi:MAG TPA: hypothetical protein VEL76_36070 [Gemmataceae bacterium]|nr:hypothetical protein [Gemmataceae bacterium]
MLRTILGAACGLLVGALLGAGVAVLIHLGEQPPESTPNQISFYTLDDALRTSSFPWRLYAAAPLSTLLFTYGLLGGGFGAVVGAIAGGTSALIRTIRALVPREPPPGKERASPPG